MDYIQRVQGYCGLHTDSAGILWFIHQGYSDIVVYLQRMQGYCGLHIDDVGILWFTYS